MLFNYVIGVSLSKKDNRGKVNKKTLLTIGIISNILLLGYFKYADFLIENMNSLLNSHMSLLHLALPLAISFFTFQQIAYLVDSYRGETKEYDFLNYANFVTFFPQLIAGPIVHHSEMMPQFSKTKNKVKNYHNIALGLFIFSIGLFKKVVIADSFAVWATQGFDVAVSLNFFEAWATSLSYTFQLYFDFSGYTDMAIGAALLFNIKLPINFNSPYKATNIQDFWKRWHITLSRFLKEYIYIPLGGNRKGQYRTYSNLIGTFLIGGIWHGAGWTFVFWGLLHGIALVVQKIWSSLGFHMHKILAWFITFNFINIAWVFFRAKEWNDALKVLHGMFDLDKIHIAKVFLKNIIVTSGESLEQDYKTVFSFQNPLIEYFHELVLTFGLKTYVNLYISEMILFGFIIILFTLNSQQLGLQFRTSIKISFPLYILAIFSMGCSLIIMSLNTGTVFLYFNF